MRLAGSIANQHDAATFIDYLLTLGITARAERNAANWDLWIFDEDQLQRGRDELAEFQAAPQAPKYRDAVKAAEAIRTQRLEKELAARRNTLSVPRPSVISSSGKRPLTMALLTMCGVAFLLTSDNPNQSVLNELRITAIRPEDSRYLLGLPEIRHGEVWRLVTPILLHFGPVHLIFNMLCLIDFGTQIELLRGWKRMLPMVLLFAIPGNLAQYYFAGPNFGGMSGVAFGLFGYIWMKTLYEPWAGFFLQPLTVVILIAGFLLGVIAPDVIRMANWCHGVGLAMGVAVGYAPTFWRNLRGGKS
ncbi:MAG: rhomboid family intramembrane serine protease [Planctomycetales bacterium]|jgi:GlpG protein|nr:rhomboid family intramembrane serine protease [Planctomycetales bacterium]MBN8627604.1 rhomboid family intramembrane serine protease [Planctomycetota bacterium]